MDVSTHPSLDLACPQAKAKIENMSTCLEIEVSIKIKYRHEGIMIFLRTVTYIYIYCHMISYAKVTIQSEFQV